MLLTMPRNAHGRRLSLHLTCIYRKSKIISCFIEKYPEATQVSDSKSKLPLHYACANLSITPQMIQQLVLAWPQSSFKFCLKTDKSDSNDDDNKNMYDSDINIFEDSWH